MIYDIPIVKMRLNIKFVNLIKHFPFNIFGNVTNNPNSTSSFSNSFINVALEIKL